MTLQIWLFKLLQPLNYTLVILKRNIFFALKLKYTYYNLTRDKPQTMYNLKNDQSVIIQEANKCSKAVIWDKTDYLMKSEKQLSCKKNLGKIFEWPLFSHLNYTCHSTENMFVFVDFQLKQIALHVKSYIKNTNIFVLLM